MLLLRNFAQAFLVKQRPDIHGLAGGVIKDPQGSHMRHRDRLIEARRIRS